MTIDNHTHIYTEKSWQEYQKKNSDKNKKVITLAWLDNDGENLDTKNLIDFVADKTNLYAIGAVNMDQDIDQQLASLEKLFQDKKILGIKLYPGYQYFYPSDPRITDIAKLCEKYNKPLVFHSGSVYDTKGTALTKFSHPLPIDELANQCPNTKIIISHFGFPHMAETADLVSKHANVYTDISGVFEGANTSNEIKNLQGQYCQDLKRVFNYYPNVKMKTMFGTDFCGDTTPLFHVQEYIKVIRNILTKSEQANAFYKLAEKLYFE